MKLAGLYKQFHEAMLQNDASHATPLFKPHARLTPEQQMAIYSEGYRSRLLDLLRENYEATRALLGAELFDNYAREYIEQVPPSSFSIDHYTLEFDVFLADEGRDVPLAASELAMLESSLNEIYWAPESAVLTAERFQQLSMEAFAQMQLPLRDSARLLAFDYEVNDWLSAFREGEIRAQPKRVSNYLIVIRHDTHVQRHALSKASYGLLSQLAANVPVVKAIETALGHNSDAEQEIAVNLQSWFANWFSLGFFKARVS